MLHNVDAVAISFSAELHLICIVIAELERKIQEGGLKATGCVNSPGPRRSALHTPWHPLSFTSCLHASSRAKTVKNWMGESAALLTGTKKKKKRRRAAVLVVEAAAMPCVRTTASIPADQTRSAPGCRTFTAFRFFFFFFSF